MKAIILIGGFGTRLRPLTCSRPKQLLPLASTTLIGHMIAQLETAKIDEIIFAAGYGIDQLKNMLGTVSKNGTQFTFSHESQPLGTAGALKNAEPHLRNTGTFFMLNGDIVSDIDYTQFLKAHKQKKATASIALYSVDDPSRYGVVDFDQEKRIHAFVEKPSKNQAPSNLVNAGCYILEESVLKFIPPHKEVSIEREIFPQLCKKTSVYGWEHKGFWIDTGTPQSFLEAHWTLLQKTQQSKNVKSSVENLHQTGVKLTPPVSIDTTSLLAPHSFIGPNVVIGSNVTIGSNTKIRQSVIFDNVILGEGVVIDHCIIGEGAILGKDVQLEGLVLVGDGAVIDSGAIIPKGALVCPQCHVKKRKTPPGCLVKNYKPLF